MLLRWENATIPPCATSGPQKIAWWADIARYQQLGVTVAFGPQMDSAVPAALAALRPVLAGGRNPLAAIARTDKRRAADNGGESGWFLRNIKGIGPETATRLHAAFGTTAAALAATDAAWRAAGASAAVVNRRNTALL